MKHLQHHLFQAHLLAEPAQADGFHQFGDLLRYGAETIGDFRCELLQLGFVLDVVQVAIEREAFGAQDETPGSLT